MHPPEYDPYSFSKEMERLDGMRKTLESVKQKFNENSSKLYSELHFTPVSQVQCMHVSGKLYLFNTVKSLLLNADVVTMFDPVSSEEIKSLVMDCKHCADRIAEMQSTNEPKTDLVTRTSTNSAEGCTEEKTIQKNILEQSIDQQGFDNESLMETDVEPVVSSALTTRAVEDSGSVCVFEQPPNED